MTDIATRPYRIDFGSHSAFVWAWLTRNGYGWRGLVRFLVIAIFITGLLAYQMAKMNDFKAATLTGPVSLIAGMVISAIVIYVLLPLLSWGWQMLIFISKSSRRHTQKVRLTENGVEKTIGDDSHLFAWGDFQDISVKVNTLLLFTGKNSAMIVPTSAFATPVEAKTFVAMAVARIRPDRSAKNPADNF